MSRVYYRWTPARRGLTGAEYLGQHLAEYFPGVNYTEIVTDGVNHFGFVEGSGDVFGKALRVIETKFGGQKLSEEEIAGAVRVYYNATPDEELGITPPSWDEYLAGFGISVDASKELDYVKAFKIALLKEKARVRFPEWNDSLADVAKAIFAKMVWYDEATDDEKAQIDSALTNIKAMYTKDACIEACNTLAMNLQNLVPYYTAKTQVLAASTIDDVMVVDIDD